MKAKEQSAKTLTTYPLEYKSDTNPAQIQWQSAFCRLGDLKDYDKNPRKIGKTEFKNLVTSIREDGYRDRLLVNTDGTIIGGHARKKALLAAGYTNDSYVEVLLPSIPLSPLEFDRINIRDNLSYGTFDMDILANNFEVSQLIDWGMPPDMLFSGDDGPDLLDDTKEKKTKTCPHCGEIL